MKRGLLKLGLVILVIDLALLNLAGKGCPWLPGYHRDHDEITTGSSAPVPVVVSIAGGDRHTIALKNDGTVWTWGWNAYGQLGDGTTTGRHTPVQVSGP